MKKDYIITFIAEFFILISSILVYKLAANFLGKDGFSEYALSRRAISFIQPVLLVGLGVGIPRFIAYADASLSDKNSDSYFISGLTIASVITFIFMFFVNLFKNQFAFIFFGNHLYGYLVFPMSLMIFGLVFHSICYSYFRGKLMMIRANFIQMINIGIIPIFIFLFFGKTVSQVLIFTGIIWSFTSLVFIISILSHIKFEKINMLISCTKELLVYGIQRVPGDLGLAAFLLLPATITAHVEGVRKAGYVAFGVSLLNMISSVFAPISLIFLPQSSHLIANEKISLLKHYTFLILKISLGLTSVGLIIFEIFANQIIKIYLGNAFSEIVVIGRIILIGSLGYVIYIVMRSIIDAYYVKAINSKNILISFLIYLILALLVLLTIRSYLYLTISFVIALFILGGLTLWDVKRIFRE